MKGTFLQMILTVQNKLKRRKLGVEGQRVLFMFKCVPTSFDHFSLDSAEQFEAMVLQGELLWDSEKHDESLPVFLRSAQLNPNNWIPFLYLGRYYNLRSDNESKRDVEKARKCFFKSFNINPRSDEAGMALSDIYREQVRS